MEALPHPLASRAGLLLPFSASLSARPEPWSAALPEAAWPDRPLLVGCGNRLGSIVADLYDTVALIDVDDDGPEGRALASSRTHSHDYDEVAGVDKVRRRPLILSRCFRAVLE